jgi:hypothetical protein
LTPSPILRALSSIRKSGAKTLLMGGQACIFYGAAEFSRDLDLLVLADADNLAHLLAALDEMHAQPVAVPAFDAAYLRRGHAVHFRCQREDVAGLRIDVMSTLRGAASFPDLWERRTSIEVEGEAVDLLALEDLVLAKKTQRDKDWPMIRRLVEQSYFSSSSPEMPSVEFWLRELRTPDLLIAVAAAHPEAARRIAEFRPAVLAALTRPEDDVARLLTEEEQEERRKDREYWDPLRRELEHLRRIRRAGN